MPPGSYGKISVSINPTDPKYAQDIVKHPPDKASLWAAPLELDGWFLEHCNIRAEIHKMTDVLRTLAGKKLAEWEIASLRAWFAQHNSHIHDHHSHEDDIFTPFMLERIKLPDRLTTDHIQLVSLLKAVMAIVDGPLESTKALSPAFDEYAKMLVSHLKEDRAAR